MGPMDSGREIELKLSVRPDRLERVMRSPHLQGESAGRAIPRALRNVYYDTPHLAIRYQPTKESTFWRT